MPTAPKPGLIALESVLAIAVDMALKAKDIMVGHRPRLVPIQVRTFREREEEPGWQVYYLWLPPAKGLTVDELQFDGPTSPADSKLPPGLYQLTLKKVERTVSGGRRAVGGNPREEYVVPVS